MLDHGRTTNGAAEPTEEDLDDLACAFPLASLPGDYRSFARTLARGKLVPLELAAASILGGVSAVVGTRIFAGATNRQYHAGLYQLILAPSGFGKTGLIEVVDQPLRTLESDLRAAKADEIRRCRADVIYLEENIKAQRGILTSRLKKGDPPGDLPQEIAQMKTDLEALQAQAKEPVMIADDFTPEAIAGIMADNDERVVVSSGDTGVFNVERYGDNPSIELLLKAWVGEPHREARKGRSDAADLKQPKLSMLVATQVENVKTLAAKNPGLVNRGLLPRFLAIIPENNIGFRDIRALMEQGGIPHMAQAAFNERLMGLARQIENLPGGTIRLAFNDGAREAFIDFWQEYENRMGPTGDLHLFGEAAGKLPIQLQKLVGVNWAMNASLGPWDEVVTPELVAAAAAQLEFFIPQMIALYDQITVAPEEALANKIRLWCQYNRGETITRRKLRKSTARRYPRELYLAALRLLEEEGIIRVTVDTETGGRPSVTVTVL